jgi:hypothetical protein
MEKHIDLQAFDDDAIRARRKNSISEVKGQVFDRDRYELARVGKQQVLKVCDVRSRLLQWLIVVATLWVGEHDGSFLRFDVHLGELASVSLRELGQHEWN